MLRRLFLCLLALLVAPPLHAQLDTSTVGGRVVTRRMEDPAIKPLGQEGALDLDSWNMRAMEDTALMELARLMAQGLEREAEDNCRQAIAIDEGSEILAFWIEGVTDSLEAEAWADVIAAAVAAMTDPHPDGVVASEEELEEYLMTLMGDLSEEDMMALQEASTDADRATCVLLRKALTSLAQAGPAKAGPLMRGIMSVGLLEGPAL